MVFCVSLSAKKSLLIIGPVEREIYTLVNGMLLFIRIFEVFIKLLEYIT